MGGGGQITEGLSLSAELLLRVPTGGLGVVTTLAFLTGRGREGLVLRDLFFLDFFFLGIGPCGLVPLPPLECNSTLPLVTAVLITPKGAEPPDSRRIGVIVALVLILPSETV